MTALETIQRATRAGITPSCLYPLLVLVEDSPLTPSELASRINSSAANVTGLLRRLERGGWVICEHDMKDRRKTLVTPTFNAYDLFSGAVVDP